MLTIMLRRRLAAVGANETVNDTTDDDVGIETDGTTRADEYVKVTTAAPKSEVCVD